MELRSRFSLTNSFVHAAKIKANDENNMKHKPIQSEISRWIQGSISQPKLFLAKKFCVVMRRTPFITRAITERSSTLVWPNGRYRCDTADSHTASILYFKDRAVHTFDKRVDT